MKSGVFLRIAAICFVFFCVSALSAEEFNGVFINAEASNFAAHGNYSYHEFTIRNKRSKPVTITISLALKQYKNIYRTASRTRVIPPGATQTMSVYAPINKHPPFYGVTPEFDIFVDGSLCQPSGGMWKKHATVLPGSNSLAISQNVPITLFDGFAFISQKYENIKMLVASAPVEQWGSDIIKFYGIRLIVLSAKDKMPSETAAAIRALAALGSTVFYFIDANEPWPEKIPGADRGLYIEETGFGKIVYGRPFTPGTQKVWLDWTKKRNAVIAKSGRWSKEARKMKPPAIQSEAFACLTNELRLSSSDDNAHQFDAKAVIPAPKVPMGALTITMLLFIIIIGPANYFILKKKRRELLILATAPAISFVFCGLVVLFITFREGWHSHGKASGRTYLDQIRGYSASKATFSVYSPLTRGAFKFADNDCVTLIKGAGAIDLDLDNGQVYAPSLLTPRVPLGYTVARYGKQREKLEFLRMKDGSFTIINGLGFPIRRIYADIEGGMYERIDVLAPGARAKIEPSADRKTARSFVKRKNTYYAESDRTAFCGRGMIPDRQEVNHTIIGGFAVEEGGSIK